jgi:pilus assembly protein Flp/PilA
MSFLKNLFVEEDGQDMVEYGIVIALVVIAAAAAMTTFGTQISTSFGTLTGQVSADIP